MVLPLAQLTGSVTVVDDLGAAGLVLACDPAQAGFDEAGQV